MIQYQKYYYSDTIEHLIKLIYLDHSSCVQGLTGDVNFVSPVTPIIGVPGLSSSHPWASGVGFYVK